MAPDRGQSRDPLDPPPGTPEFDLRYPNGKFDYTRSEPVEGTHAPQIPREEPTTHDQSEGEYDERPAE